jgi:small subunit ribosomal protein S20
VFGVGLARFRGVRPDSDAHPVPPLEGTSFVANIKSQIKRNRQNQAARDRNKAVKAGLRTAIRRFREAAAAGDTDRARTAERAARRKLDQAASAGVIHQNQAANRKSALARRAGSL